MNLSENKHQKNYLKLTPTICCLCENAEAQELGKGEDFEYQTSADSFAPMGCRSCGLVYLNPRPDFEEFERIYPSNYHAFEFSAEGFGFVFKVRRRLEAKRLLTWCKDLSDDARIIDIGCGSGISARKLGRWKALMPMNVPLRWRKNVI